MERIEAALSKTAGSKFGRPDYCSLITNEDVLVIRDALVEAVKTLEWYADRENYFEDRDDDGDLRGHWLLDGPRGNSFPDLGDRARQCLAVLTGGKT